MVALHGCRVVSPRGRAGDTRYQPVLNSPDSVIIGDADKLILLARVRAGIPDAIEKMIMCHLRLAVSLANRYVSVYGLRFCADDLDSAAYIGVVEAVNRVAKGNMLNHDNITGYIVNYIHQNVSNAADNSVAIHTPQRKRNKIKENMPLQMEGHNAQQTTELMETWEAITSIARNSVELKILELKRGGNSDEMIGCLLGCSRGWVTKLRRILHLRYLEAFCV